MNYNRCFYSALIVCFLSLVNFSVRAETLPASVAIATAHPYATDAGVEVLQAGGNAFDAAVAITATLAVVEPYASGLGGGGFWLLHHAANGKQVMLDGREKAPLLARQNIYLDKYGKVIKGLSTNGAKAAAIPGVPAALEYLAKEYGRLPLKQTLAAAIKHAEQGFPVTDRYQKLAKFRLNVMRSFPETAAIFLEQNNLPALGYNIIQKDLAAVLTKLSEQGASYFYHGELAEKMVATVAREGGIWSMQDLALYRLIEREPIIFNYKNVRIVSASPPSSGGITLAQSLGILETFDLSNADDIDKKHLIIEAMRRAYRDRAAYLGDPDFIHIPTQKLLNQEYIDGLAITIDNKRATASAELGDIAVSFQAGEQTTHFSVIDEEGNRVAATLSINLPFGSGLVVPGTGVLLNNEMDDFSAKPKIPNAYGLIGDQANAIESGKRPLSSMTPTFIESDDGVAILGTPGGSRIISMVLLAILDFVDGNLPSSWVSIPRYHHQYIPDEVQFEEDGLSVFQQRQLEKRGHVLKEKNRTYGNMQAILWHKKSNKLFAASDPRGEGKAVVITTQH